MSKHWITMEGRVWHLHGPATRSKWLNYWRATDALKALSIFPASARSTDGRRWWTCQPPAVPTWSANWNRAFKHWTHLHVSSFEETIIQDTHTQIWPTDCFCPSFSRNYIVHRPSLSYCPIFPCFFKNKAYSKNTAVHWITGSAVFGVAPNPAQLF